MHFKVRSLHIGTQLEILMASASYSPQRFTNYNKALLPSVVCMGQRPFPFQSTKLNLYEIQTKIQQMKTIDKILTAVFVYLDWIHSDPNSE